tara:strand:- start:408 stop:713 length:306 start_codon:yes stop_codon:yes gene_type:complete
MIIDKFQALRDIGTDNEQIRTIESDIKRGKRSIKDMQEETYKNDYRIGKLGSEINRVESEIKERTNHIKKIAKESEIEWFRSSWMKNPVGNKLEEIRYWCS